MIKSQDFTTNYVLNYIGKDKLENIDTYVDELRLREYIKFNNIAEIDAVLEPSIISFLEKLSFQEEQSIKDYTGLAFKNINAILRDKWNYEENGLLTEQIRISTEKRIRELEEIFKKTVPLPMDIITYRGVNIRTFYSYGVTALDKLPLLEGQYFFEKGFTSTSLIKDTSFFDTTSENGLLRNIEIEYMIPQESDDGMALITENLSCSTQQNEFLIRNGTLSKIISVTIENDKAHIKMAIIPQQVWNEIDYQKERQTTLK